MAENLGKRLLAEVDEVGLDEVGLAACFPLRNDQLIQ